MLRFNATIYTSAALESAISTFADFGTIEWNGTATDGYFSVTIAAADDVDASELTGEFGNFALARSLDARE